MPNLRTNGMERVPTMIRLVIDADRQGGPSRNAQPRLLALCIGALVELGVRIELQKRQRCAERMTWGGLRS